MRYPYGEARALYEWGEADRTHGQGEQAQERLAKAHEILQRLGAKPLLNRVQQALSMSA